MLTAAMLLILGGCAIWFWPREPKYHGRTLAEWFEAARADGADAATIQEFNAAVLVISTNNFPRLISLISTDANNCYSQRIFDSLPGTMTPRWLSEYLLDNKWKFAAETRDAAEVFKIIGERGSPAIPELTKIAMNGGYTPAMRAVDSLGYIGQEAVPALIMIATNPQPQAARAMGWLICFTNSEKAMRLYSEQAANPDFRAQYGSPPTGIATNVQPQ
jgi:hypothetical protein